MVRNVVLVDLGDIAVEGVTAREVLGVSFLGVRIPFAGEYALATDRLKGPSDAANASEQVDEAEVAPAPGTRAEIKEALKLCCDMRGWHEFAGFPSPEVSGAYAQVARNGLLGMGFTSSSQVGNGCGIVRCRKWNSSHTAGILPDIVSGLCPPVKIFSDVV